jgi:hypothetical protein
MQESELLNHPPSQAFVSEEVFDRPNCPASFIPGYLNKDDAIARAKLVRILGREGSHIILVRLTRCEPKIDYRRLEKYAKDVDYKVTELTILAEKMQIICIQNETSSKSFRFLIKAISIA